MPLSYSQLNLFRRCPRQYEFACVKKLPRQISAGESFGSSVHNTLKQWGEREQSYKLQAVSDQLAMFENSEAASSLPLTANSLLELWHTKFITEGYESKAAADFARTRGEKLMEQFFAWWQSADRTVVTIETGFTISIEDTIISGRFDRVEQLEDGLHVIDYKTGKPRSQDKVDADLQLSIYALAAEKEFQKPCLKLTLLFLDEDEVTIRETERNTSQLNDAKKQILSICEQIESKDFHPTPGKNVCKHCPYKNVCDSAAV